jgi:hypothetical protein
MRIQTTAAMILAVAALGWGGEKIQVYVNDGNIAADVLHGQWIYFCSDRSGRQEIWRMPFGGGTAQQVTDGGGFVAFESTDGTTLLYTKGHSGPLFAKPLSGGPERQLRNWVTARAFFPVGDGIYYLGSPDEKGQYPLEFFQFPSQKSEVLTNLDGPVSMGLSVSPNRT